MGTRQRICSILVWFSTAIINSKPLGCLSEGERPVLVASELFGRLWHSQRLFSFLFPHHSIGGDHNLSSVTTLASEYALPRARAGGRARSIPARLCSASRWWPRAQQGAGRRDSAAFARGRCVSEEAVAQLCLVSVRKASERCFFLREIVFAQGRKRERRREFRPNLSTSQYQEMSPERRKGHPPPLCPSSEQSTFLGGVDLGLGCIKHHCIQIR